MKIECLATNVTSVGCPARAEHNVLVVFFLMLLDNSGHYSGAYHHYARRTYIPSPSTARLRLGKKVEFTRQYHPTSLHGCICPKMGHLQAVVEGGGGWVLKNLFWLAMVMAPDL